MAPAAPAPNVVPPNAGDDPNRPPVGVVVVVVLPNTLLVLAPNGAGEPKEVEAGGVPKAGVLLAAPKTGIVEPKEGVLPKTEVVVDAPKAEDEAAPNPAAPKLDPVAPNAGEDA